MAIQNTTFQCALYRSRTDLVPNRRLLISQDRHQVHVVVATYDDHYVDYIKARNPRTKSFLQMEDYGPFDVTHHKHMYLLGRLMLALSLQGGVA